MIVETITTTKVVNAGKLHIEVSAVIPSLLNVRVIGPNSYLDFSQALTQEQRDTVVPNLIDAHQPLDKEYRLYDYVSYSVDKTAVPDYVNYKTGLTRRLHPKHEIVKGELQKTTYYVDLTIGEDNQETFETPVLEVSFVWNRNENGFVYSRESTIQYYFEDGTLSEETKYMIKGYNYEQAIKEAKRRRQNIVDAMELSILALMRQILPEYTPAEIIQFGREWMTTNSHNINNYIQVGDTRIMNDIANDVTFWMRLEIPVLNVTIREYILNELTV